MAKHNSKKPSFIDRIKQALTIVKAVETVVKYAKQARPLIEKAWPYVLPVVIDFIVFINDKL